jgi:hypothetical protein
MSTIEQPAPALRLGFSFGPSQPPRSLGCSLPSGRARLDAIFISEKAFHHAQQIQTVRQIDVAHEAEHRRPLATTASWALLATTLSGLRPEVPAA